MPSKKKPKRAKVKVPKAMRGFACAMENGLIHPNNICLMRYVAETWAENYSARYRIPFHVWPITVTITPTKPTKVKAPEAVKCWAGITQTGRVQRWESENDGNRHLAIYPTRRDARSDWTMVVPGVFTPTKPTRRKT